MKTTAKPTKRRTVTDPPHSLWQGMLTASRTLPWYHEDATGFVGFSADPPPYAGTRYRLEWPRIGKWHVNPTEKKP